MLPAGETADWSEFSVTWLVLLAGPLIFQSVLHRHLQQSLTPLLPVSKSGGGFHQILSVAFGFSRDSCAVGRLFDLTRIDSVSVEGVVSLTYSDISPSRI